MSVSTPPSNDHSRLAFAYLLLDESTPKIQAVNDALDDATQELRDGLRITAVSQPATVVIGQGIGVVDHCLTNW